MIEYMHVWSLGQTVLASRGNARPSRAIGTRSGGICFVQGGRRQCRHTCEYDYYWEYTVYYTAMLDLCRQVFYLCEARGDLFLELSVERVDVIVGDWKLVLVEELSHAIQGVAAWQKGGPGSGVLGGVRREDQGGREGWGVNAGEGDRTKEEDGKGEEPQNRESRTITLRGTSLPSPLPSPLPVPCQRLAAFADAIAAAVAAAVTAASSKFRRSCRRRCRS